MSPDAIPTILNTVIHFIFIRKKTPCNVLRGFLCPWKKRVVLSSEGCATHPIRYRWPFGALFFIWTCWLGCEKPLQTLMAVWHTLNFKKVRRMAITICSGQTQQTWSLRKIVCRGQEGSKGIQANTWLVHFLKPMSPLETGRSLWGNPGIVLYS